VSCKENLSTNGIVTHEGLVFGSATSEEEDVSFTAWDLGGQECFYPTHQVRAKLLLEWRLTHSLT